MSKKKRVMRQSSVSQQLARLRLEGLVSARLDGKTIHYNIAEQIVRRRAVVVRVAVSGRLSR
jgi:ArsR family transcriptional regulator